jgi:hypothetical protein
MRAGARDVGAGSLIETADLRRERPGGAAQGGHTGSPTTSPALLPTARGAVSQHQRNVVHERVAVHEAVWSVNSHRPPAGPPVVARQSAPDAVVLRVRDEAVDLDLVASMKLPAASARRARSLLENAPSPRHRPQRRRRW